MKNKLDYSAILTAVKEAINPPGYPAGLHEPNFTGNEWKYVKDCLDSGWVSSKGGYVDKFEKMLVDYTGAEYAVAVVNGTAALHVCLELAGVEPGDEVLIPALSFAATANAAAYCGAVPHFIDSEEQTLGADPAKLDDYLKRGADLEKSGCVNKVTGRRIKAVVPVHTFGHPVDLEPLIEVCRRFSIEIIEDASESLGSFYKGRHTGNWGKASVLSFNGNKIITTGGGGAVLTNDEAFAKTAKHISTTAKIPHRWEYVDDRAGYNYRMPGLNASLGCAQREGLPCFVEKKRNFAARYENAFSDIEGIRFFTEPGFAKSNYWLNVLLLEDEYASFREELLEVTNDNGIMTRPAWALLNKLPMYSGCPAMDLDSAQSLASRIINLPSSVFLV